MTDPTAKILEDAGLEVIGTLPAVGTLTTASGNAIPFKVISPLPEYDDLDQVNTAWLAIAKDYGLLNQDKEFAIRPGGIGAFGGPWYPSATIRAQEWRSHLGSIMGCLALFLPRCRAIR